MERVQNFYEGLSEMSLIGKVFYCLWTRFRCDKTWSKMMNSFDRTCQQQTIYFQKNTTNCELFTKHWRSSLFRRDPSKICIQNGSLCLVDSPAISKHNEEKWRNWLVTMQILMRNNEAGCAFFHFKDISMSRYT